jgi:surface antigen
MKIKATIATMLGMTLAIAGATTAEAAPPTECVSSSYICTTNGYQGVDIYDYWTYGGQDAELRWHNCTAYAAYQISLFTVKNDKYKELGMAKYWASRAPGLGLKVSTIPRWRDIAFWSSGHVAFVEDVVYFASGRVAYIVITEDNAGVDNPAWRLTKRRVLYPSDSSFPDKFITFPAIASGGGRPPVAYITPLGEAG